jgi:hypothetical protein
MRRMREECLILVVACLGLGAHAAWAQRTPQVRTSPGVVVVGTVVDSMRGAPLVRAFISLAASGKEPRSTLSDEHGRFRFDSVAPGPYVVAMQHALLDTLGLTGTSRRVDVTDGRDTVRLATPSFERLWRFECDGEPPRADSGFVFGTVRSATTRRPLAGATVTIRWTNVEADKAHGVAEREWRADAVSDSTGDFRVCDVPSSELFQVRAAGVESGAAVESGQLGLMPNGNRIRRIDLVLGAQSTAAGAQHGVVIGVVTVPPGKPVAGTMVTMEDSIEARTDSSGVFVMRNAPVGTHQLEARFVGMAPGDVLADVYRGDTTRVAISMSPVTKLAAVEVTSRRSVWQLNAGEFENRKSLGFGYFRDSTRLAKHGTLVSVFAEIPGVIVGNSVLTRGIPGISFPDMKGTGRCTPSIWVDGILTDLYMTDDIGPDDLAAVEVYPHALATPAQFLDRRNSGICGAVVLWTKRAFP